MTTTPSSSAPTAPAAAAPKRPRPTSTQPVLGPWVRTQALNLHRHVLALRPFEKGEFGTGPQCPSDGHIMAVNQLIEELRKPLIIQAEIVKKVARLALRDPRTPILQRLTSLKHRAHRQVLKVEKVWDCYVELFDQRQSPFGPWLLACDRIALDCYKSAYVGVGTAKPVPAPPPFSYMRTGFGPATYRRRIPLSRLGREQNPFPLVHLPYHRLVNPWTLGAILHEVSHNLQSDLGLDQIVPKSIARSLLAKGFPPGVAAVFVRWNRETFADLAGLLLGGPCVVASLMDVVGRSPAIVSHYDPRGVHPTPWLRVLISCHLLERMGFPEESKRFSEAWLRIYPKPLPDSMPATLLRHAPKAIPVVVDRLCYQPFAALGNKRLCDLFRFAQKDQRMVEEAAGRLGQGTDPGIVPERFLIGAARVALDQGLATPKAIREHFYAELGRR